MICISLLSLLVLFLWRYLCAYQKSILMLWSGSQLFSLSQGLCFCHYIFLYSWIIMLSLSTSLFPLLYKYALGSPIKKLISCFLPTTTIFTPFTQNLELIIYNHYFYVLSDILNPSDQTFLPTTPLGRLLSRSPVIYVLPNLVGFSLFLSTMILQ